MLGICASDWHRLQDHITINYLVSGLDGELKRNRTEIAQISRYIRTGLEDTPRTVFDWTPFVEENFDLVKQEEGDTCNWDKDQWYCKDCMMGFLRSGFRKWWIAKKKEGESLHRRLSVVRAQRVSYVENIPFAPDDCWYGYNCRTQRHKVSHAEKLNVRARNYCACLILTCLASICMSQREATGTVHQR